MHVYFLRSQYQGSTTSCSTFAIAFRDMKKNDKYDWYVDSEEDQNKEERRVLKGSCHCFTHTGHPRRVYPIADVSDGIRKLSIVCLLSIPLKIQSFVLWLQNAAMLFMFLHGLKWIFRLIAAVSSCCFTYHGLMD